MATLTPNFGLSMPDETDNFSDFRESYNENLEIIDNNLGGGGGASALEDLSDVNITNPTDGQVLKYDAQNDEWINANGGGGGGHAIVNKNGSTMPTETALQFTGNVSVSDDNVNGRTVVDILGGGGSGMNYSTNEQVVGTWIDGKPLYQKTWDLGQDITVGAWTSVMSVADANIDVLVSSISTQQGKTASMIEYWVDGTTLKGNTLRQNFASDYVRYLTLQYTKTTD